MSALQRGQLNYDTKRFGISPCVECQSVKPTSSSSNGPRCIDCLRKRGGPANAYALTARTTT